MSVVQCMIVTGCRYTYVVKDDPIIKRIYYIKPSLEKTTEFDTDPTIRYYTQKSVKLLIYKDKIFDLNIGETITPVDSASAIAELKKEIVEKTVVEKKRKYDEAFIQQLDEEEKKVLKENANTNKI